MTSLSYTWGGVLLRAISDKVALDTTLEASSCFHMTCFGVKFMACTTLQNIRVHIASGTDGENGVLL